MGQPTIETQGIYKLEPTTELYEAQFAQMGNHDQCRDHFSSLVLIEVIVRNIDDRFSIGDFAQAHGEKSLSNTQVAWDEALLTEDGQQLTARGQFGVPRLRSGSHRLAFFLHFYDPELPILWTYGEIPRPPTQAMPTHLAMLVPYNPCD
ncbi:MAG: hypothetical protein ABI824_07200 [Acidobacteriota bacterium]